MQILVNTLKIIGQRISDFTARMILTLVYFLLLTPIALWQRRLQNPSAQSAQGVESFWSVRDPDNSTLEDARRTY